MQNYYRICFKLPMALLGSWLFFRGLKHFIKLAKSRRNYSIQNLALKMEQQCTKKKKNLSIIYNHTINGIVQKYTRETLINSSKEYLYSNKKKYGCDYLSESFTLIKEKGHLEQIFYVQDFDQGDKKVLVTIKNKVPQFQTTYKSSKFKQNQKEAKRNWLYKTLFNPYLKFYKTKNSLKFNSNIFLSGNFIYNHKTGILRCFRVKQISINNDIYSHIEIIVNWVFLFALGCAVYSWIVDIYNTIKKRFWENKQISRCGYFCLQCQINRSNMIVFPCGHLSICQQCSADARTCPKCRQNIKTFQLIYQTNARTCPKCRQNIKTFQLIYQTIIQFISNIIYNKDHNSYSWSKKKFIMLMKEQIQALRRTFQYNRVLENIESELSNFYYGYFSFQNTFFSYSP
ncbi:Prokaryotic RING finger 4 [Paramecium bursaria]